MLMPRSSSFRIQTVPMEHLGIALKHEGVDLRVLHCLFQAGAEADLAAWIGTNPAGAYKRRWQADRGRVKWLRRAHDLYRTGWKADRENAYLGINAATTALWLDDRAVAASVATAVRDRVGARAAAAAGRGFTPGFWDQVTLAEAHLVLGQRPAAAAAYRAAFRPRETASEAVKVSRDQAAEVLRAAGAAAAEVEQFLADIGPDEGVTRGTA